MKKEFYENEKVKNAFMFYGLMYGFKPYVKDYQNKVKELYKNYLARLAYEGQIYVHNMVADAKYNTKKFCDNVAWESEDVVFELQDAARDYTANLIQFEQAYMEIFDDEYAKIIEK